MDAATAGSGDPEDVRHRSPLSLPPSCSPSCAPDSGTPADTPPATSANGLPDQLPYRLRPHRRPRRLSRSDRRRRSPAGHLRRSRSVTEPRSAAAWHRTTRSPPFRSTARPTDWRRWARSRRARPNLLAQLQSWGCAGAAENEWLGADGVVVDTRLVQFRTSARRGRLLERRRPAYALERPDRRVADHRRGQRLGLPESRHVT